MTDVPPGRVTLSDRRTERSCSVALSAPQVPGDAGAARAGHWGAAGRRAWGCAARRGGLLGGGVRFCNALPERDEFTPVYRFPAGGESVEWDHSAGGYRLPTEAESEHACRSGTTGPRYGPLDQVAWCRGTRQQGHDAGGKQPNRWGLYDMLGSV